MNILAIDSSGLTASVAVLANDIIRAYASVNNNKTHSQTLLPMVEQVLRQADMKVQGV